jgi:hypothetical protein
VGNKIIIKWEKEKFRNKQFVELIFGNKRNKNENNREQKQISRNKKILGIVLDSSWNKSF